MSELLKVGITHGDYNGVGYEVTLKALANELITELFTPVFYAVPSLVERLVTEQGLEMPPIRVIADAADAETGYLNVVDIAVGEPELLPGTCSHAAGAAAVKALEMAVEDVKAGKTDAIVTAPISKEAVQGENFNFVGHTEFLGARTESQPQMILFSDRLRVALLHTHRAISEVAAGVTRENIVKAIREFDNVLRQDFDVEYPKIAVLSLNPHCGDGGLLGTEEIREISPAIKEVSDTCLAFGPYATDGFFASGAWTKFDGVLAMYHDQGLAPFKALAGTEGVNFTAGLPFVRTSPDHGTGYDIAWKGEADPQSMRQALYAAVDLTRNRARYLAAKANPLPPMPERPERSERVPREHKSHKPNDQNTSE